jgi:hypothetical protein
MSAASPRAENPFDLRRTHPVEIVRHLDQAVHETDTLNRQRMEWDDFDYWFPRPCDYKRLALGGAIDQARQMGSGLVNVDGSHSRNRNVSLAYQLQSVRCLLEPQAETLMRFSTVVNRNDGKLTELAKLYSIAELRMEQIKGGSFWNLPP